MNTVKLNSKGPDVLFLQARLGLKTDGDFGPKTEEAVKKYQEKKGLVADGVVGPKTWSTFVNMPLSESDYVKVANKIGCDVAAIKAIRTVESGGKAFVEMIRPAILFEAHIFWQRLKLAGKDPQKLMSSHPNIISPKWNRSLYRSGNAEYPRLEEAWGIDPKAALESASIGLFQVMGFNCKTVGENDVFSMWANASLSEAEQLNQFGEFIIKSGIAPYLIKHDWASVARKYNGPKYAENKYDIKLANAYKKFSE